MINKKGFSFVELIVSVTILALISTIGFISYSGYLGDSRDSQRKSDLSQVGSALKVYKQKRGYYPLPGDSFDIVYKGIGASATGASIAYQGKFNDNVRLNTLDRLPLDPKTGTAYFYSIVNNKQQYEMAATLENEDDPLALVYGTYKSVSIDNLPGIILAIERDSSETATFIDGEDDETGVDGVITRNKFIFDNQSHNLPYTFTEPYEPYTDGTTVEEILTELEITNSYWQNTDYRNCLEIEESGKAIQEDGSDLIYQIITDAGTLEDTTCTFN